jgi:hypothetical protein
VSVCEGLALDHNPNTGTPVLHDLGATNKALREQGQCYRGARLQKRICGPLMDRFDIHIDRRPRVDGLLEPWKS